MPGFGTKKNFMESDHSEIWVCGKMGAFNLMAADQGMKIDPLSCSMADFNIIRF
jgi:hypothetical protein